MPRTKAQRALFALMTVVITVHAYVFYSLYVVNGDALMRANQASTVLEAIARQGGVMLCGRMAPIPAVVLTEFLLAFALEMTLGSPLSIRLVRRCFDPGTTHPVLFETAVISATVGIMCPAMSLIASALYYPYYLGFHLITLLASWLKLMCFNFPFAWFTQVFLIQPLVRTLFRALMGRRLAEAPAAQP